jgi:hypothetical protein
MKNIKNNSSYRLNVLNDINNQFGDKNEGGFLNQDWIENLREQYGKTTENVRNRLINVADRRKSQIDREAANKAKAVYNEAKDRAISAKKAVSSNTRLLDIAMQDIQATTEAAEQAEIQTEIDRLTAEIKVQQGLQADAEKQVTRLLEAKENSDKLANLADEIANAKESTDAILDDLIGARDELLAGITARENERFDLDQKIETLQHEFDIEQNEEERTKKEARLNVELNNREAAEAANRNDQRLADTFETQIRGVQNNYIIDKAILENEITNAQLLVAINQNINAGVDIEEINAKLANATAGSSEHADLMLAKETAEAL